MPLRGFTLTDFPIQGCGIAAGRSHTVGDCSGLAAGDYRKGVVMASKNKPVLVAAVVAAVTVFVLSKSGALKKA